MQPIKEEEVDTEEYEGMIDFLVIKRYANKKAARPAGSSKKLIKHSQDSP